MFSIALDSFSDSQNFFRAFKSLLVLYWVFFDFCSTCKNFSISTTSLLVVSSVRLKFANVCSFFFTCFLVKVHWFSYLALFINRLNFCRVFNGKAINIYCSAIVEHAYTDASLSGFGALIGLPASGPPTTRCSRVFACPKIGFTTGHEIPFPLKTNVNYLELYAALQAIRRWSPHWANCHVCLHTDNTQAMAFLNKGSCKNPTAMDWLREIFWLSALYNFRLTSRHITGLANVFADRLSRVTEIYTPWIPPLLYVV